MNDDGTGFIHEIEESRNHLSRKAPRIKGASRRGERLEQIIAANLDDLYIVTSVANPRFNNRLVDRIIVTGESSHINVNIVINKTDLKQVRKVQDWIPLYENIGYGVFLTSTVTGEGIDELRESLQEKMSIFWGSSGVGKSSLMNALFPHLEFKTGDVSESTSKGTHTTVTSVMEKINNDTYVIDTPGIREIDPFGIMKEDLGHYFVDFEEYIHDCKFNTCTHQHEPGCAVIAAVEGEEVSEERYQSYLNMLETIEDDMIF